MDVRIFLFLVGSGFPLRRLMYAQVNWDVVPLGNLPGYVGGQGNPLGLVKFQRQSHFDRPTD